MPIILVATFLLFPTPAYAYLDPGTGSMILQGLLASIAAVSGFFWMFWYKVKSFFVRDKKDKREAQSTDQ